MFVFFKYVSLYILFFFFFNDTATTEIYTLSLHDALPISSTSARLTGGLATPNSSASDTTPSVSLAMASKMADRKSTRLNSSHSQISYAVFCLKKKKNKKHYDHQHQLHSNITNDESTPL